MQAIGFLSRREYSRQELRAKLLSALRQRERAAAVAAAAGPPPESAPESDPEHEVDTLQSLRA